MSPAEAIAYARKVKASWPPEKLNNAPKVARALIAMLDSAESTNKKSKKYDEIAVIFWSWVVDGNPFQSTIAAAVIRQIGIEGPNGEDPESA